MARKIVYVHFKEIHMIDDSDDLSDGEFQFYFFVNDHLVLGKKKQIKLPGIDQVFEVTPNHLSKEIGSGQKRSIDWLGAAFNVDQVKVSVSGVDNDDDPDILPTFNPSGTGVPETPFGTGESSWAEWATGSVTVNTPDPPQNKADRSNFVLDANGHKKGVDVRFKVSGEIIVTFG